MVRQIGRILWGTWGAYGFVSWLVAWLAGQAILDALLFTFIEQVRAAPPWVQILWAVGIAGVMVFVAMVAPRLLASSFARRDETSLVEPSLVFASKESMASLQKDSPGAIVTGRDNNFFHIAEYHEYAYPPIERGAVVDADKTTAIVFVLGQLRAEGVKLRNAVQYQLSNDNDLQKWVGDATDWRDRAVQEVAKVSPADSAFIQTLNTFQGGQAPVGRPIAELVGGIEHQRWADIQNERLSRLEQFLGRFRR